MNVPVWEDESYAGTMFRGVQPQKPTIVAGAPSGISRRTTRIGTREELEDEWTSHKKMSDDQKATEASKDYQEAAWAKAKERARQEMREERRAERIAAGIEEQQTLMIGWAEYTQAQIVLDLKPMKQIFDEYALAIKEVAEKIATFLSDPQVQELGQAAEIIAGWDLALPDGLAVQMTYDGTTHTVRVDGLIDLVPTALHRLIDKSIVRIRGPPQAALVDVGSIRTGFPLSRIVLRRILQIEREIIVVVGWFLFGLLVGLIETDELLDHTFCPGD